MEVSALKYTGVHGLHGRSPLLRLQSDERLIAAVRRGNHAAFEALVRRYETRLLAFCRHLLGSREDAEDVLQEAFAAAFNAILADEREINVRPWLYRIARNRSLNHLRRAQAIGVDSMDVHFSDNGLSTADKVHEREEFRLLVGDIHELPETQRTALLLREMEALSYDQIAEAMETSVPSVKSLLVRARVSLAEAAEARQLSCDQVRIELGETAEGLRRRPGPLVRRHLRSCERCSTFRVQLRATNKALAALLPVGPIVILKKLVLAHLGHSVGAGSGVASSGVAGSSVAGSSVAGSSVGVAGSGVGVAGSGAVAAGSSAVAAGTGAAAAGTGVAAGTGMATAGGLAFGSGTTGLVSAGVGAIATKVAAGLAATVIVTAGAVEVEHATMRSSRHHARGLVAAAGVGAAGSADARGSGKPSASVTAAPGAKLATHSKHAKTKPTATVTPSTAPVLVASTTTHKLAVTASSGAATHSTIPAPPPGRTQHQTDTTILPAPSTQPTTLPPPITTPVTTPPPVPVGAPSLPGPGTGTTQPVSGTGSGPGGAPGSVDGSAGSGAAPGSGGAAPSGGLGGYAPSGAPGAPGGAADPSLVGAPSRHR